MWANNFDKICGFEKKHFSLTGHVLWLGSVKVVAELRFLALARETQIRAPLVWQILALREHTALFSLYLIFRFLTIVGYFMSGFWDKEKKKISFKTFYL